MGMLIRLKPVVRNSNDPSNVNTSYGRPHYTRHRVDVVTQRVLDPSQYKHKFCSLHPDQPYAFKHVEWYKEYEKRGATRKDWFLGWYEEVLRVREVYVTRYALMCDGSVVEEDTELVRASEYRVRWQQITWWGSDVTIGSVSVGAQVRPGTSKPIGVGVGPSPDFISYTNDSGVVQLSPVDFNTSVLPREETLVETSESVEISPPKRVRSGTIAGNAKSEVDENGAEVFQTRLVTIINAVDSGKIDAIAVTGQFAQGDYPVVLKVGEPIPRESLPKAFFSNNSGLDADSYEVVSFEVTSRRDTVVRDGIIVPLHNVTVSVVESD